MSMLEDRLYPGQKVENLDLSWLESGKPTVFDMFADHDTMTDPYPLYRRLLTEHPVQDIGGPVVFTRWADIALALRHSGLSNDDRHDLGQKALAEAGSLPPELVRMMDKRSFLHKDPPDHTRLRGVISEVFSPRRTEPLRPFVQQVVDDLIDAASGGSDIELISELAYPLPIRVVSHLLGVPAEDHLGEKPWTRAQLCCDFEPPALAGDCAQYSKGVQEQMSDYFHEVIAERRGRRGDDIISVLLDAEEAGVITLDEVVSTCRLLVVAGHETTTGLITNGMLALLRHPEQLAMLREDAGLAANAVEEVLRYDAPIQFTRRVTVEEVDINGTTVEAGKMVLLWLGAAGRDPDRFEDPDTFDITRKDTQHLQFGAGIHFCLGAPLARMQGQIALHSLSRRLVAPSLAQDPPPYMECAVHAMQAMPIKFEGIALPTG